MRILFWTEFFVPHIGGIEVRVGQLATELCGRGHMCGVITNRSVDGLPAKETWRGVSIYRLPIRDTLASRDIRGLRDIAEDVKELRRTFEPNLEEVFISGPSFIVQQLSNRMTKVPTIASLQGSLDGSLKFSAEMRKFLASCSTVITVSEQLREHVCVCAPEIAGYLQLLHNCLPMPTLAPQPLPQDPPTILCLGRLIPEKGFDVALRALARLKGRLERARMLIAGDGSERRNLESLSRELDLAARVEFLGWVNPGEVPALINRATLMVTPSRWQEAFGLVSLQAAQMGRPVVATRVGGIPEVVLDAETGLLVENEDVDGMTKAIASLLSDPERMHAMGEAGRRRAIELFDFQRYVDCYEIVFRQFAGGPSNGLH